MRRLAASLIIAAFCLGICGARVGRPDVSLEIRGSTQSCPQFSIYLPCDDSSSQPDVAKQPLTPPSTFVFFPELSWTSFLSWNCPGTSSPSHYAWLGLGCGGLPS
jgi:hypothetical protein